MDNIEAGMEQRRRASPALSPTSQLSRCQYSGTIRFSLLLKNDHEPPSRPAVTPHITKPLMTKNISTPPAKTQ